MQNDILKEHAFSSESVEVEQDNDPYVQIKQSELASIKRESNVNFWLTISLAGLVLLNTFTSAIEDNRPERVTAIEQTVGGLATSVSDLTTIVDDSTQLTERLIKITNKNTDSVLDLKAANKQQDEYIIKLAERDVQLANRLQ